MKDRRILVTGGAGFIGSHTVEWLLNAGAQVVILDNLSSGRLDALDLRHPNVEFFEGDVLEYPLVEELLTTCDAVLHLAAIASVPQTIKNPIYSFQVNTQGVLHVLEAIRAAKRPIRFVYASSAAVYGEEKTLPCREDRPLTMPALSPYALQKRHDEEYADLYARLHGVNSLGLRYFNVYGLRQDPHSPYSGVISRFLEAYQQSAPLTLYGDGSQSRDFINVVDVAKANVLALQSQYTGILNIATGVPQTLLHLIEEIEAAGGGSAKVEKQPARPGDILSSYGSTELAEAFLRFKSSISLKDGIRSMIRQQ